MGGPRKKGKEVSYEKVERQIGEILRSLEEGAGRSKTSQTGAPAGAGRLLGNGAVRPIGGHLPVTERNIARQYSWRADRDVLEAIAKVALYLQVQREHYYPLGEPLKREWMEAFQGFYSQELLEQVRLVEFTGSRVENPWFYGEARERGISNLPDIAHKVAVTFLDVVVFNQPVTRRDLFHNLVHAAQVKLLGEERFAELFVTGFLQARSYFLIPLKAHAFALDTRYAEDAETRFSVEEEIARWIVEERY